MIEHSIETTSGLMFDFDCPRAECVDIYDVARALSNIARFGGHTRWRYSVAEHAVLVYRLVKEAGFPQDVCRAALHHDSHEAYLGDIPTPLKRKIKALAPGVWENLVADVDFAICNKFGVKAKLFHHDAVEAADAQALSYEAAVLKPSGQAQSGKVRGGWVEPLKPPAWAVKGWSPARAEAEFLDAYVKTYD